MKRGLLFIEEAIPELIFSDSLEDVYGIILSLMDKSSVFERHALYVRGSASPENISVLDEHSPKIVLDAAKAGREAGSGSERAAPVIVDGEVMAVIYAFQKEGQEENILGIIAELAAASIKNMEIKRKMGQSEKMYRDIIENAVEGIYVSTLDGQIIEANQALVDFFGYENKEELKKAGIHETYVNPERRKEFVRTLMEEKKVRNYEIEYRKKDGEIVIGNEFASLVGNGEIIQGIIHDVTELKKIQREVEFYNALLRHDMWNKNQVVMGYLQLLSDTGLSEEQNIFIERAKLAVRNNISLIEDIKKLFSARSRQAEEVDLDRAMENVINQLLHEADKKGISIYYMSSGIKVAGIPLLEEVFYNILLNSILHSKCRNIHVSAIRKKNLCRIKIEDDGVGIPPEIKEDIFSRKVSKSGGNGLGLYLSGKIVKMGGGSIGVKNRVENGNIKGAIFEISLPIQNDFKR